MYVYIDFGLKYEKDEAVGIANDLTNMWFPCLKQSINQSTMLSLISNTHMTWVQLFGCFPDFEHMIWVQLFNLFACCHWFWTHMTWVQLFSFFGLGCHWFPTHTGHGCNSLVGSPGDFSPCSLPCLESQGFVWSHFSMVLSCSSA